MPIPIAETKDPAEIKALAETGEHFDTDHSQHEGGAFKHRIRGQGQTIY